MIEILTSLSAVIYVVVFGVVIALIDIEYIKRRDKKEAEFRQAEADRLKRLIDSVNRNLRKRH
ncbi:MAG: hypothetical protein WCO55_00375 [Candidatus Falkowbacteria bacterium]